MEITKNNTVLKRPFESLPKEYKEYQEIHEPVLLNSIQNNIILKKEMPLNENTVPRMFLLYEEQLNLPLMNLEELKMVFPYMFDKIMSSGYFHSNLRAAKSISADELEKLYVLSKTKRIPLLLAREYETARSEEWNQRNKSRNSVIKFFDGILAQTAPDILAGELKLLLQAGAFPGAEEKLAKIHSLNQLFKLYYYYDSLRRNLNSRLYWYTLDENSRNRWTKTIYPGNTIEVECAVFDFLQLRFLEWEKPTAPSLEEQTDFLMEKITDSGTLMLDKTTLLGLLNIAGKSALDDEKNKQLLIHFMETEAKGLELLDSSDSYWYTRCNNYTETFSQKIDDVTVHLSINHIDEEQSKLVDIQVEGFIGPLNVTFDKGHIQYHPILKYTDIWKKNKFQGYARLLIEGERQIEMEIPQIVNIERGAFRHLNVEELTIKDSVQTISEEAFSRYHCLKKLKLIGTVSNIEKKAFEDCAGLNEIIFGDNVTFLGPWCFKGCTSLKKVEVPAKVRVGNGSFADCTQLKKAILDNEEHLYWIDSIFSGCTELNSIIGPTGEDYLHLNPGFPMDEGTVFHKNRLFWEKIVENNPKKLLYLKGKLDNSNYGYWHHDPWETEAPKPICCDSLEELHVLEGTEDIGDEFLHCRNLRKIVLPQSLRSLAYNAFENCPDLNDVLLPKMAEIYTISGFLQRFETKMDIFKKIIIPEDHCYYKKVDSIVYEGNYLCWASDELEGKVVVQEGTIRIGEYSFYNCDKITVIVLPKSLKFVEYGAFFGCSSLERIVIQSEEVLVDSMEPDAEVAVHYWCSGPLGTPNGKKDVMDQAVADKVIIESTCVPKKQSNDPSTAYNKNGKKKGDSDKDRHLTYRPFADIYKLLEEE